MSVSSFFSRFLPGSGSASSAARGPTPGGASATAHHLSGGRARPRPTGDTLDAALRLDRFHRAWSSLLSAAHAAINAPKGLDPPLSTVADPLATVTRTLLADTAHGHTLTLGPCLDYVLAHHVLTTLVDTAASDQPLGFFAQALDALAFLVHTWPAKLIVAHPPVHLALRHAFTHALANQSRLAHVYPESLLSLVAALCTKLPTAPELVHILIHDRRRYSTTSSTLPVAVPPAAGSSPLPGALTLSLSTSASPRLARSTSLTFPSPTLLSSSPTGHSTTGGRITSPHTPARAPASSRSDASLSHPRGGAHRHMPPPPPPPADPPGLAFPLLDTLLQHIHQASLAGHLARLTLALLLDHACGPTLRAILAPPGVGAPAPFLDAIPATLCALWTSGAGALHDVVRWVAHVTSACPSPTLVAHVLDRIERGFLRAVVAPQLVSSGGDTGDDWERVWTAADKMLHVVRTMPSGPLARVLVETLLARPARREALTRQASLTWVAQVEARVEARANEFGVPVVGELRATGLARVLHYGSAALDPLADSGPGEDDGFAQDGAAPNPRATLMSEVARVFAGEPVANETHEDSRQFACVLLVLALVEYHPLHALPLLVPSLVAAPPAIAPMDLPARRPSDTSLSSAASPQPSFPVSAAAVLSTSPPLATTPMSRYESVPALEDDFPLAFVLPPPPATAPRGMPADQLMRLFRRLARTVELRSAALTRQVSPIARQPSLRNLLSGTGSSAQDRQAMDKVADRFRTYLHAAELGVSRVTPWSKDPVRVNQGETSVRSMSSYYTAKTDLGDASESWANTSISNVRPTLPGEQENDNPDDDFLLPSSSLRDEPATPGPSETLSFDQFLKSAATAASPQVVDLPAPAPTPAPLAAAVADLAGYSSRSWPWRRRPPPTADAAARAGPPALASLFVTTDTPAGSTRASPLSPTSPASPPGTRPRLPEDAFLQLVVVSLTHWQVHPPQVNLLVTGMLTGLLQASVGKAVDATDVYHRDLAHVVLEWALYVLEGGRAWVDEEGLGELARGVVRLKPESEGDPKWCDQNERIMAEWAAEVAAVAVVVVGRCERVSIEL